ncbi:MAG: hypothetical protein JWN56_1832 [Sphingobacteriales bacterium]|nr:hypothetical protein [Sphingobacteriales bacterium]
MLLQIQFTPTLILWLLGCLILGVAYAFILYGSSHKLGKNFQNILFVIRAISVSIIAFLLFAPLVKSTNKTLEKPLIILAQDNSASIGLARSSKFKPGIYSKELLELEKSLAKEYEVRSYNFGNSVKRNLNFSFTEKQSDLASVFKLINDQFANRNVGAVVLATDGIYNRGGNPQYGSENLKAPIYTIALGDTVPKRDLLISNINYNNIAYLDNQFQLEVSIEAFQSKGTFSKLTVSDNQGVVFSKPVTINSNEYRQTIPVTLLAKRKGIQRFNIALQSITNELSILNNWQTLFVDVIDGKQNVLIIANAPHPDLSALKQAIEINKNYAVKIAFPDAINNEDIEKAGLIILHQLPSLTNSAQFILSRIKSKPTLFILGLQSATAAFSSAQSLVNVASSGNASQEAIASISKDFYAFTLSDSTKTKLQNFRPLLSPFGSYTLKGASTTLLNQQIGKVVTGMPLLVFGDEGGHKIGVLSGEGLWKWRLEEFQESGNHNAVNELVNKTVQYLSSRDDKRKFRVYTSKNTFDEQEHIILNAELYNDAYELINTPEVSISLKNKAGKNYNYIFSKEGNAYKLDAGILPTGEYSYEGKTQLGSKRYIASGQFVITEQQAELQQTVANHQMLYALSEQSGGKMIFPDQVSGLKTMIAANENVKTLSYQDSKYEEVIDLKTIFFLIIGLLTIEWFSRKRNGEI